MNQSIRTLRRIAATSAALLAIAGCGGGSNTTPAGVAGTLTGVAAVGSPIVGGTVKIVCSAGPANANATTNSTGAWQTTVTGQTFPCAAQVSGGTIKGAANPTVYHALALDLGVVNITPLTDLLVANLSATSTPASWFTALGTSAAPLQSIGQAQADAALAKLRAALGALAPLATVNPVTASFTATPGNINDDILSSLQIALTNLSLSYTSLVSNAATGAFTPPAGLGAALATAYSTTPSGTPSVSVAPAPASVQVAVVSQNQLTVTWTAASGATSYNVYRSTAPAVQVIAGNKVSSANTATSYSDTGLTATTAYYYKVTAVNSAGESIGSAEVAGTTPAPAVAVPAAPTGLSANAASASQINLAWTGATNATGYNVYRAMAANVSITPANKITTTPITAFSFNDTTGLASTTSYYYKVTSLNSAGESLLGSTEATATTSAPVAAGAAIAFAGIAGTGSTYSKVKDGTGSAARFELPLGMVADKAGNLYVADFGAHNIRRITPEGVVTTFAGPAGSDCTVEVLCPNGFVDGTGTAARFSAPRGMAIDSLGNLFVGNYLNIRKITPAGVVTTLAGPDSTLCPLDDTHKDCQRGFVNGSGTAVRFDTIMSMATDAANNLYVVDSGNNAVRKITPAGVVSTFATTDKAFKGGIAVDSKGNVYVGYGFPSGILKYTSAGVQSTFVASDIGLFADDIAIDADDTLYVSNFINMKIGKVSAAGVVTSDVVPRTLTGNDPSFPTLVSGAGNGGSVNNSYIAISGTKLYIAEKTAIGMVSPRP